MSIHSAAHSSLVSALAALGTSLFRRPAHTPALQPIVRARALQRSARSLAVLLFLMVCLAPECALAQPATDGMREHYQRAHRAMDERNWTRARELLSELWARSETYDVAGTLAEVEYQLGNYAQSARYLTFALANLPPKENPEPLRRFLARLRTRVGAVSVSVSEDGAELWVDGERIGDSPHSSPIYLMPGAHSIEARKGGDWAREPIEVQAGREVRLELRLDGPEPEPAPVTEPADAAALAPQHEFAMEAPPRARSGTKTALLVTGGALSVLGVGAGIGFGLASNAAEEDVEARERALGTTGCAGRRNLSIECLSLQQAYDRQRRTSLIGNLSFGIGAVAALGTLGLLLLWPDTTSDAAGTPQISASVVLEPRGAGAAITGSF